MSNSQTDVCWQATRRLMAVLFGLLLSGPATSDDDNASRAQRLESLNSDIETTEQQRASASNEKQRLLKELQQHEVEISAIAQQVQQLQSDLDEQQQTLSTLKQQEQAQRKKLSNERQTLGRQIRSAYLLGRTDYLKLLLNQQDPARLSRVLAYYDYHNRSHGQDIQTTLAELQTLSDLKASIASETAELDALQVEQQKRLEDYSNQRQQRQAILQKLNTFIDEKDQRLAALRKEARQLGELLQSLDSKADRTVDFYEDVPPFQSMRGKMPWPVKGQIIQRFGTPKKGDDLKWNGVLIKAATGTDVKAINNGKVVFADWFKHLGMLLIVDHGNGYMSLYAHNETLYKKQNDWVLAGETIASVGDSGGQQQTSLYFEIRQQGKPVNPSLWCKK